MQTIEQISKIFDKISIEKITSHPNILIAARFWDEKRFRAALTCYHFMRKIDDMVDDRKSDPEIITCMEKEMLTHRVNDWIRCLTLGKPDDPLSADVSDIINEFHIPHEFFQAFARSMIYDVNHYGFSTYDDFLEYSEGASNGPASVFLHLCCLEDSPEGYLSPRKDIMELARPCALFSYIVHIIRDFQKDQLSNLNYFSADLMKKYEVDTGMLKRIALGAPITHGFRNLIGDYRQKAEEYMVKTRDVIDKLSTSLSPRYLTSLKVIFELYLQVFEKIDIENGSFTSAELNPSPAEIRSRITQLLCASSSLHSFTVTRA